MRGNLPRGKGLSSEIVSRWLEWLATRMNGSDLGRCWRPRTRSPMNNTMNGRTTNAKNVHCTKSRALMSVIEIPNAVEKYRRRITERVHSVKHPTVAGNEFAKIFHAEIPLNRAHHCAAEKPRHCNQQRYPRSEEHTSELQSRGHLVCRLLL